jgi:4-hydroxy-tetrahydrodipicolinate synthase
MLLRVQSEIKSLNLREKKMDGFKRGVWAAMTTPFTEEGAIDVARFAAHAADLLRRGCVGVSVFGTTGEGPSIGISERAAAMESLLAAAIAPERIMPAVTASALEDALAQAQVGAAAGCRALLVTPPFYFKDVPQAGVVEWYSAFLAALPAGPGVLLYHIPQLTGVPVAAETVAALRARFGDRVLGVKDSSGDWTKTERLLKNFPDLAILIGDERFLARGAAVGGAGTISGLANLRPDLLAAIVAGAKPDKRVDALVEAVLRHPVMPAIKALVAHQNGDPAWLRTRPPLQALSAAEATALAQRFDALFARKVA